MVDMFTFSNVSDITNGHSAYDICCISWRWWRFYRYWWQTCHQKNRLRHLSTKSSVARHEGFSMIGWYMVCKLPFWLCTYVQYECAYVTKLLSPVLGGSNLKWIYLPRTNNHVNFQVKFSQNITKIMKFLSVLFSPHDL